MPKVITTFSAPLWNNADELTISGGSSAVLQNCYFNKIASENKRILCRRPGLKTHIDIGTAKPIDGLYWWDYRGLLIVVSDGKLFKVTDKKGAKTEISITGIGSFNLNNRCTFATEGEKLLIASGGTLVQTDGTTAQYLTDTDAPTNATHVLWVDTYYMANVAGSDKVQWTTVGNNIDTWDALDYGVAMASPDDVIAIVTDGSQVLFAGKSTIEIWYNDGVTPFSRYESGTMDVGCIAPYSMKRANGQWVWLNDRRQLCIPNGRTSQSISYQFDGILQTYSRVEDAIADVVEIAGQIFYIISFPSENKTHVINMTTEEYVGEWTKYNKLTGDNDMFIGSCVEKAAGWNQVIVGSRKDSTLYIMSPDYFDDDNDELRGLFRSGWNNHGNNNRKSCNKLAIRTRRDNGTLGNTVIAVRYRDDGKQQFGKLKYVDMTKGDTKSSTTYIYQLGTYIMRQYEIQFTGNVPFYIIEAEESMEMRNG